MANVTGRAVGVQEQKTFWQVIRSPQARFATRAGLLAIGGVTLVLGAQWGLGHLCEKVLGANCWDTRAPLRWVLIDNGPIVLSALVGSVAALVFKVAQTDSDDEARRLDNLRAEADEERFQRTFELESKRIEQDNLRTQAEIERYSLETTQREFEVGRLWMDRIGDSLLAPVAWRELRVRAESDERMASTVLRLAAHYLTQHLPSNAVHSAVPVRDGRATSGLSDEARGSDQPPRTDRADNTGDPHSSPATGHPHQPSSTALRAAWQALLVSLSRCPREASAPLETVAVGTIERDLLVLGACARDADELNLGMAPSVRLDLSHCIVDRALMFSIMGPGAEHLILPRTVQSDVTLRFSDQQSVSWDDVAVREGSRLSLLMYEGSTFTASGIRVEGTLLVLVERDCTVNIDGEGRGSLRFVTRRGSSVAGVQVTVNGADTLQILPTLDEGGDRHQYDALDIGSINDIRATPREPVSAPMDGEHG